MLLLRVKFAATVDNTVTYFDPKDGFMLLSSFYAWCFINYNSL